MSVNVEIYVEKLSNLVHSEKNPRYIKAKRKADLEQSLSDFPEMKEIREIVIDENNLILAGDKRAFVLDEMGYTDVKVKRVTGLTEKQKREFIVKDNDHNGDWDPQIIAEHWDPNELAEFGIPKFKMPGDDDRKKDTKDVRSHTVECPGCGLEFDPKEAKAEDED